MDIGIVGLPHVGKATLFNALTGAAAAASNFPFTTIEPNVGVVPLPDPRLSRLSDEWKSAKITPASSIASLNDASRATLSGLPS